MDQFLPDNETLRKWLEANGPAPEGLEPDTIRAVEEAGKLSLPDGALSVDAAWATFASKQELHQTVVIKTPSWRKYIAIAATVLVLLATGWLALSPQKVQVNRLYTTLAQHDTATLPDGSTVILNAVSSIDYNSENWEQERKINLKGEAFFHVAKGSTFTVHTELGKVTVLGTSFNVYARNNTFEVACLTGKVKVISSKSSISTQVNELSPGEIFTQKQSLEGTVDVISKNAPDSWRKGEFNFENEPLNEVIAVMERQFGIQIDLNTDTGRMYTGNFTTDDLEEAFVSVARPLGLKVHTIGPKHYRLSGTVDN